MRAAPTPRVELHLHLEGSLTLADALRLARRHRGGRFCRSDLEPLYRHADFGDFLRHFGAVVALLREPGDLVELLGRLLIRLRRQGVLYAEVRVSPSVWERHGLGAREGMEALARATYPEAPEYRLIVDAVRHWGMTGVERDLSLALAHRRRGVVALGLGGDEAAAPARTFGALAETCSALCFPLVPHAGEALGPQEVADAVSLPGVTRIGHGIAAAGDPGTLGLLRERGTHLEVCPASNFATGVVRRGTPHPVGDLFRAGVSLSLSTDDPALFGTTLAGEERLARAAGLGGRDLLACRAAAARASFLPRRERESLAARFS